MLVLAEGAWCMTCGAFYVGSDPADEMECGHGDDDRIFAMVVAEEN